MANTNAFTMRRKNEDLRAKYRTILDELAESSSKKGTAYEAYLARLDEILPRNEKSALPAKILAERLTTDEKEQASICQSIAAFATYATTLREITKQYGPQEFHVSFPDLYTVDTPIVHHFAELDEEDNIIRQWNITSTETRYYLKKKG